jgi:hypothetical protein
MAWLQKVQALGFRVGPALLSWLEAKAQPVDAVTAYHLQNALVQRAPMSAHERQGMALTAVSVAYCTHWPSSF